MTLVMTLWPYYYSTVYISKTKGDTPITLLVTRHVWRCINDEKVEFTPRRRPLPLFCLWPGCWRLLAAAATAIPAPTVELSERHGSDYVFMLSKIHSRRLTGPQQAMQLTDYYWLMSGLVWYFGPKSGGTFVWASPSPKSGGTRPLCPPCRYAHGENWCNLNIMNSNQITTKMYCAKTVGFWTGWKSRRLLTQ